MNQTMATCLSVGPYCEALTWGHKYEVLSHDTQKRMIRIKGDNNRTRWFNEGYFDLSGADAPTIESIWIEAEMWPPEEYNTKNGNTSVLVKLSNGRKYSATLIALQHLARMFEKNRETAENLSDNYFWVSDMIIVDEISRTRIQEVVEDMLHEDELGDAWELDESDGPSGSELDTQQEDSSK